MATEKVVRKKGRDRDGETKVRRGRRIDVGERGKNRVREI